ncbi:MAG: undecaprenyldiphospho-muramoylpentapeptide beta-N-acetylglucosaminyltransferase [Bacteroidales bacterium]|jgi:UDP-N-acetylglucosamine--N-acetylmuramyl-(pentapeptide) pyrophosphoryl-undecaprenol N-acetylglucosamine transferase|nr:undecaprenyldiphospho-muramoylpentapeptide beta-N-acetylglucosaminyltransferase [Bacteroidales bacterium]MDI9593384.1 undecaprenyldiphospho-muramoylpentapeptide beta-N-acetylglucosaminyltransferase [Bacteroidota bacterium]HOF81469.1 undecaprenyldiphospho-muramoylpentapeptide beta-N-acetylglucosaminyltransferase [Bacteroidales bacterium]HOR76756.1 undecaprenyldiphospho-muramoylpentapeptide beta-N-acetylglucosaminyltransferase [Bacteroidales bacterium]HPL12142.1 undecaprenyldiphospho-muramoylp
MVANELKILISGGGTGGHIFPAIAIADALRNTVPDCDILFVGALGKMEMEKVPQAGYPIKGLRISAFQRRLSLKNLSFPLKVVFSMVKAYKIITSFKPDVVVGVGGFASGPTLKVAVNRRIPVVIQEQNSYPGITNRLLAKHAEKICVAYDGMEKWFPAGKILKTGNPVRENVINIQNKKDEAFRYFELESGKPVVLIVGGSQGALSINQALSYNLKDLEQCGVQMIWQTGKLFANKAKSAIQEKIANPRDKDFHVYEFITRMDLAYAAADLVISRAGAIAISELSAVQKPSILIPYPAAAEDHQAKNAKALADKQAAIFLADSEAKIKIATIVKSLIEDEEKRDTLSKNIGEFAVHNSAQKIAEQIIKIASKRNGV